MVNVKIKFTAHAETKIKQRNISKKDIEKIIAKPEIIEPDKFDNSLVHYIGLVQDKYLRVIGRRETKEGLLIISCFFDRRLKKRRQEDAKT